MKVFWPAGEPAQLDYEALRAAALAGSALCNAAAARFDRRGLAGLIAWPDAETVFCATVLASPRPPWTPTADPRVDALAASYELLLSTHTVPELLKEAHQ
jgi:hypothetical protein